MKLYKYFSKDQGRLRSHTTLPQIEPVLSRSNRLAGLQHFSQLLKEQALLSYGPKQAAKFVHWLPNTCLKLCALCAKLLRPQDLEETVHLCGRGQEEVAKIVQCGEHLS